jgi:hypothetical protein
MAVNQCGRQYMFVLRRRDGYKSILLLLNYRIQFFKFQEQMLYSKSTFKGGEILSEAKDDTIRQYGTILRTLYPPE